MTEEQQMAKDEERRRLLSRYVSDSTLEGWIIKVRNDLDYTAVLSLPEQKVNNTLHAIITVFTCILWAPIWAIIYGTRRKERRLRITIGPDHEHYVEDMTID